MRFASPIGMFEEMGYRNRAILEQVDDDSRQYFKEALRTGKYRGWLAEKFNGEMWQAEEL